MARSYQNYTVPQLTSALKQTLLQERCIAADELAGFGCTLIDGFTHRRVPRICIERVSRGIGDQLIAKRNILSGILPVEHLQLCLRGLLLCLAGLISLRLRQRRERADRRLQRQRFDIERDGLIGHGGLSFRGSGRRGQWRIIALRQSHRSSKCLIWNYGSRWRVERRLALTKCRLDGAMRQAQRLGVL